MNYFSLSVYIVSFFSATIATIDRCNLNCVSPDRIKGPTRPSDTRPYPWKIAPFPTPHDSFCKMGCQLFFTEYPWNVSCKSTCDLVYRYRVTDGYSDQAEIARLECHDGCDIAVAICQAGYYCRDGFMKPCAAGTYRDSGTGETVHQCIDCPYGRYRARDKGKSADECTKCTYGKYSNITGAISESACLRCPAGKTALEEGMRLCVCITKESCDMEFQRPGQKTETYYKNGVDYYRESIPYEGRW